MTGVTEPGDRTVLDETERERFEALAAAECLADLRRTMGAATTHDAYFRAKREWATLRGRELATVPREDGLPGTSVLIDGTEFHVHGVTHADTLQERAFVREHVSSFLDDGAAVYCEQGIRPMYFGDFADVYEMDDYRWAMTRCEALGLDDPTADPSAFSGLAEDVDTLAGRFREVTYSLIDSGGDIYGEQFKAVMGDVASYFLVSHEDAAIGADFESFTMNRRAATDPRKLGDLQRYYAKSFLPQPVEREWLRRHDPELELLTHARNERLADYAVYHHDDADAVHLIVGAAHQPGIAYYLRQYASGEKDVGDYEPVP